jgi:ribosomal-protein-alanine N-acetyltransferase
MTEDDIKDVLEIETEVFKHPWSREFFNLIINDTNNYVITLRNTRKIIGYGGFHLINKKIGFLSREKEYHRIIHLMNIAIAPPEQRRGFGTYLMHTLLCRAYASDAEYCYLEVRPSNEKAFSFYRKCGFSVIGIIDNYYPEEKEHALVMGRE